MKNALKNLYLKNLDQLEKELLAYESEELLYAKVDSIPNSGGNLVHHLCGNVQHFIGAILGKTGYVRDRDAEFSAKIDRDELLEYIQDARGAIEAAFDETEESDMENLYPIEVFGGQKLAIVDMLLHLLAHFNYHVGQINYHRRLIQHTV
ncbi:DUF1572 domain-containing protein [Marinilongibacter aquaticus]|uniref:DinB family protein n=1 Tax=Marinilongibacter aquaticus TaxID=2975157 RepID=UPI0021BD321F|nr:DUF1572 domain-containing protein [Marinilongibacter aquaticus]UBM57437.1 DUF1572 domain-containing protein [Marinilongibacter aquaticus]